MAFRKVEFIKDFANRKKGTTYECEGMEANTLVRVLKVAKYPKEKKEEK